MMLTRLCRLSSRPLKVNVFVVKFTQTFWNVNSEKLWTTRKEKEIKRRIRRATAEARILNESHSFILLHWSDLWAWCLFNFEMMLFTCWWEMGRKMMDGGQIQRREFNEKIFIDNDELLVMLFRLLICSHLWNISDL